uniref:Si:ch211-173a9.6 n=1 Tax=Amphiprion percula TaxID=161767 RepID=A0A3P8SXX8_AMPPE
DLYSLTLHSSVGEAGQCICHVYLPDTTFPADRVQQMQEVSKDLLVEMVGYEGKLEVYLKELKDLTVRVSVLEGSSESYIKLDFELLRIELREFEALVSQLKHSLNSSSPIFDSLHTEILNMTNIVNQLESYDQSNLLLIRYEFAKLQKKLKECQEENDIIEPDIGELMFLPNIANVFCFFPGNCNHTGILSISKPVVIQLNAHLSPSYQYGGWGKDSKPLRGYESMYFYGAYNTPAATAFNLYSDYDKLILRSAFKTHSLSSSWRASGNNYIVHGNAVYYQHNSPFSMTKLNLTSSAFDYRVIPAASARFSYSYSADQNLDFSADEIGLWVMYASEESKGKMVLAKINEKSFGIENEWKTGVFKEVAGNAFMACGVMYVTRSVDLSNEEIFYAFDTKTGEEKQLSIPFQKFQQAYSNLHYNPTDQKLYMYNNGYYIHPSIIYTPLNPH